MTEAEWLACEDPEQMSSFLQGNEMATDRKWYLFACTCLYDYGAILPNRRDRREMMVWINATERYVDGLMTRAKWEAAGARFGHAHEGYPHGHAMWAAFTAATAVHGNNSTGSRDQYHREADMVRDIFGNPFRPASLAPAWRTDTVVLLAEQMYESRDFSALPILADALQDAGCDNTDVLDHCRGAGPHVRGCWVVDLVLGKE